MIKEAYCSFEVSKLLKEKGFNWDCITYYVDSKPNNVQYSMLFENNTTWEERCYSAPTHQMAMAWLREVHGIFIGISLCERYENKIDNDTTIMFFFELLDLKEKQLIDGFSQEYTHTYEDAVEAALKYVLENLI